MWRPSGYYLVCTRAVELVMFSIARLVFRTVQICAWKINGTDKKLQEARLPENYDRCVQVLRVVWWNKFDIVLPSSLSQFICVHDRFESPKYIFDNDTVSLFMMNDDQFVFSEPKDRKTYLWKTEYGAFIRESQVIYSKYLLIVPKEHFHRMAEELGDPQGRIIFSFNTTRCGSTLLGQMAEETGVLVTLSEPNQLNELATLYKHEGDSKKMRELARDVVRWTCRPYHGMKAEGYFVKLISPAICSIDLLKEVFPDSSLLFMYRDVIKVAKSLYRTAQQYPSLRLVYTAGKISPSLSSMAAAAMGFYGPEYRIKNHDNLTVGVFNYIATAKYYVEMRAKGVDVAAVRYEDLVADPTYSSKQILKYCKLPERLLEPFARGIHAGDSQRNSVLSREILGQYPEPELTPASKEYHDQMLKKSGLPLIGSDGYLENTISMKPM